MKQIKIGILQLCSQCNALYNIVVQLMMYTNFTLATVNSIRLVKILSHVSGKTASLLNNISAVSKIWITGSYTVLTKPQNENKMLSYLSTPQTQFKFHPLLRPLFPGIITNNRNVAETSVFARSPLGEWENRDIILENLSFFLKIPHCRSSLHKRTRMVGRNNSSALNWLFQSMPDNQNFIQSYYFGISYD